MVVPSMVFGCPNRIGSLQRRPRLGFGPAAAVVNHRAPPSMYMCPSMKTDAVEVRLMGDSFRAELGVNSTCSRKPDQGNGPTGARGALADRVPERRLRR